MKKILYLLFITFCLFSCSKETIDDISTNENLTLSLIENNITQYNGMFTTLDSKYRAKVNIKIPASNNYSKDNYPKAMLTFQQSKEFKEKLVGTYDKNNASIIHFSSGNLKFTFSINEDVSRPLIFDVFYKGVEGDIVAMKSNFIISDNTFLGTYNCDICGSHPSLETGLTQTFNAFTIDNGDGTKTVCTQTVFNNTSYIGIGSLNTCTDFGDLITCEGTGETFITSDNSVQWDALESIGDFSADFTGIWSWNSPTYGFISGSFAGFP